MSKSLANRKWVCALCAVPLIVIASFALFLGSHNRAAKTVAAEPAGRARLRASYAALPLAFEQNQGQTDSEVKYMARGDGYTLFLTPNEAVFSLRSRSKAEDSSTQRPNLRPKNFAQPGAHQETTAVVRMKLAGANPPVQVSASDLLPGKSNYFIGNDPANWRTDVPHYARVSYQDVYPGVDLAFHGAQSQTEFDFLIAPGADPTPIAFNFAGAQSVRTDDAGNLAVSSAAGNIILHKPVAYQEINGSRQLVDAKFVMQAANKIEFALGSYDRSRELVIDPSIAYAFSTYLGGSGNDEGQGIGIDSNGNIYVTGQTASTNFPTTTGAFQGTCGGCSTGGSNVFVSKIASDGSSLIYSTYVGGSGTDSGNSIAIDSSGDVFVAGATSSKNFPKAGTPFQGSCKSCTSSLANNAFVFELNSTGSALTYSTYLGGTGNDVASGIALASDGSGDVLVVGSTSSTDFPTSNPLQGPPTLTNFTAAFVTKFNSSGSALVYSTYLGGSTTGDRATSVAVDASDNSYIAGQTYSSTFPTTTGAFQTTCGGCGSGNSNAFVTVISPTGSNYVYSTFLGGSGPDKGDGIAVDSSDNAYITGATDSNNFPVQSPLPGLGKLLGVTNAFVTKLNPTGSALVYSTYLGGSGSDAGASISLDSGGDAYVTGQTNSPGTGSTAFPTANAIQATLGGGYDAFVSEINPAGSQLIFSTYLGGSLDEDDGGNYGAIAVDSPGANIYVTGNTASTDFPIQNAYQNANGGGSSGTTDAFVTKYAQPAFSVSATAPSSVNPGSPATSTVTLTSFYSYGSPVNLSCTVTGSGSPLPACSATSFSTNPVTPTSAGATSTLTITTTGPSSALAHPRSIFYAMWLPVAGISLAGFGFSSSDSRRRKLFGMLMLLMVISAMLILPACGGSSSSGGGGGGGGGGTPAGNYTVTITGTGTDTSVTTRATTVTLTVN